jgi:LCP family protein required for cell wall assembly
MFDELDDSQPFTPNERFRTAVMRRSRTARRRRAAIRVGGVTCAAAIALPAAFAFYEYHRLDNVRRIAVPGVGDGVPAQATSTPEPTTTVSPGPAASAESPTTVAAGDDSAADTVTPPDTLTSATTFLIIGVDAREEPSGLGSRTDTLMLLSIDPDRDQMRLLSIPRDLWVSPPGSNSKNRINSITTDGDFAPLVATIEALLDVSIDHLVEVDFGGFKDLTDLAGGVSVISDVALRDSHTGLSIPGGECVTLDGEQALALVRSRHTQYFDGSKWIEDPRSDFGRIARQQIFLRALTGGLLDELDDPGSIDDFVDVATKSLVVDDGLDSKKMISTAWTIRGIGLAGLQTATVQATGTVIGGAAVLEASEQQIADATNFLREGSPPAAEPGTAGTTGTGDATSAAVPTAASPDLQPCPK